MLLFAKHFQPYIFCHVKRVRRAAASAASSLQQAARS